MRGSNLPDLHDDITDQIERQRKEEIRQRQRQKASRAERADQREEEASLEAAGLDVGSLRKLENERVEEAREELEEIEKRMAKESSESVEAKGLEVEDSFLPESSRMLTPVWVAGFSDSEETHPAPYAEGSAAELSASSDLNSQLVLSGGSCKNYYNWASGGGWGCTDGVGSNQSWVEFGFWFRPEVNKHYAVIPKYRYRGFHIVRADDEWYNCKHASVKLTQWVNVRQYNWKGWTSETVYNIGSANINRNQRFDDDRTMYSSYLLGGGDWAFIRCVIGLYARAKGGGSYAKNDFSTGSANYLCVPRVYVY